MDVDGAQRPPEDDVLRLNLRRGMALFCITAMRDEVVTGLAPRSSCRFQVGPIRSVRPTRPMRPLRHAAVRHLILPASAIRSSDPINI
jgi:hypothetical protein